MHEDILYPISKELASLPRNQELVKENTANGFNSAKLQVFDLAQNATLIAAAANYLTGNFARKILSNDSSKKNTLKDKINILKESLMLINNNSEVKKHLKEADNILNDYNEFNKNSLPKDEKIMASLKKEANDIFLRFEKLKKEVKEFLPEKKLPRKDINR
jgi:transcriptional regulator of heat shock response